MSRNDIAWALVRHVAPGLKAHASASSPICLSEGAKRGTISGSIAKLILEPVLPASRPVQLDLPVIKTALNWIEAEDKITQAMNDGRISPAEALHLQAWAKTSFRNRRVAKATMGDECYGG